LPGWVLSLNASTFKFEDGAKEKTTIAANRITRQKCLGVEILQVLLKILRVG